MLTNRYVYYDLDDSKITSVLYQFMKVTFLYYMAISVEKIAASFGSSWKTNKNSILP